MFTMYKDASKFANETLAQSSSESELLVAKTTSTKRKKKIKAINFSGPSSDDKQSDNELPPFPKFKKNDSKETEVCIEVSYNNTGCSLNVVSNENQNIVVINKENNQNIDLSNGFRSLISTDQNCIFSDESSFTIDNHDIGVGNGLENVISIGNKNQNYSLPEETVNNQADTMQEINFNDIDYVSFVSTVQNKQKTHISSEVGTQISRQLVALNARSKEQGDYLHTIMMVVSNIQEKQDILCKHTSSIAVSSTINNDEFGNICTICFQYQMSYH